MNRNDLLISLFSTAANYLEQINDYERMKKIDLVKWRHVETVIASEPSSEPGMFRLDPVVIQLESDGTQIIMQNTI